MEFMYKITGGTPVNGEIECMGAKNLVTKAMVASILAKSKTTLLNVPNIGDVDITIEMMESIGVTIQFNREKGELVIDPSTIDKNWINMPHSGSNRIPILLLGPLLHRFKEARVPVMGGCNIGARRVDFHLDAIEKFGGTVNTTEEGYSAHCNQLTGCHVELPYPSVGATESCLFLSVLAKGDTVITNAAQEPEIQELITLLRALGAIIYTYPDRKIVIEGVNELQGTTMKMLTDRIEGASWACLACATNGDIVVKGLQAHTLGNFLPNFQKIGGGFELLGSDSIRFYRKSELKPIMLQTDVFPGFSTDWQQPFVVLLTQANGTSVVHETVYEKRFDYTKALNLMGANTQLTTYCLGSACRFENKNHFHSAIINGATPLRGGTEIVVPDLRAGLAYVIAAAIANGETTIKSINYIERGFE